MLKLERVIFGRAQRCQSWRKWTGTGSDAPRPLAGDDACFQLLRSRCATSGNLHFSPIFRAIKRECNLFLFRPPSLSIQQFHSGFFTCCLYMLKFSQYFINIWGFFFSLKKLLIRLIKKLVLLFLYIESRLNLNQLQCQKNEN